MSILNELLAALRSLLLWWVVVTPWQKDLRVRMGARVRVLGPGIHLRIPFVDVIYVQPTRRRAQLIRSQTLTTADGKTVVLSAALQFSVCDLEALYQRMHDAHDTVEAIVQGLIARVVRGTGSAALRPDGVENEVRSMLQLEYYGLCCHEFAITNFAMVRAYRLVNGSLGEFTGYDQRFTTQTQERS